MYCVNIEPPNHQPQDCCQWLLLYGSLALDLGPYELMDFLKSAVASAISKGPAFPYTFGDRVELEQSIWTLHNGTKRVWSSTRLGKKC